MTDQLTEVDMLDAAIEAARGVKLPCDVRIGAGTFKRGVPVSTLLMSIQNHIGYAQKPDYPFTDGYLDKQRAVPHGPCCECDPCTDRRALKEAQSLGYTGQMKWLCPVCLNPTTEQDRPCSEECLAATGHSEY